MTAYRVTTPVPGAMTEIGPVLFVRGAAEIDDSVPTEAAVLSYCRSAGYGVTALADELPVTVGAGDL
jgi:hypothetical protein